MAERRRRALPDALSACEQGRIEDGVAILHRALVLAPGSGPHSRRCSGKALTHLGRNEEALASLRSRARAWPGDAEPARRPRRRAGRAQPARRGGAEL